MNTAAAPAQLTSKYFISRWDQAAACWAAAGRLVYCCCDGLASTPSGRTGLQLPGFTSAATFRYPSPGFAHCLPAAWYAGASSAFGFWLGGFWLGRGLHPGSLVAVAGGRRSKKLELDSLGR